MHKKITRFAVGEIESTNDMAAKVARETHTIAVVSAQFQTKGRGRMGREWIGNPGENVYCSIGIPEIYIHPEMNYQSLGAVVVCETLQNICTDNYFTLKYPNDVYVKVEEGFMKIAGILVEQEFMAAVRTTVVIGIGINVLQRNFGHSLAAKATSLYNVGCQQNVCGIVDNLVDNFLWKTEEDETTIYNQWKQKLNIESKSLQIKGKKGEWKVQEIQKNGRLIVENTNKEQIVVDNGDSIIYNLSPC